MLILVFCLLVRVLVYLVKVGDGGLECEERGGDIHMMHKHIYI